MAKAWIFFSESSRNELSVSGFQPNIGTQFSIEDGSELTQIAVLMSSSSGNLPDLDWALIEIIKGDLQMSNDTLVGQRLKSPMLDLPPHRNDVAVVTCTGSKHATNGLMSGSSTFMKLEYGKTFQELSTVTLNGSLCKSTIALSLMVMLSELSSRSVWRFRILDC